MASSKAAFAWAYAAYGLLLALCGSLLSGGGDGPMLAFALFGSPLTVLPLIPWHPLVWGIFGWLMATRPRGATALLAVHYAVAPAAMSMNLKFGSSLAGDIAIVRWQFATDPVFGAMLVLPYVVGQMITWHLLWRAYAGSPRQMPRRGGSC